jgi:hypothetical protein
MFVDCLAHCVWRGFERGNNSLLAKLGTAVQRPVPIQVLERKSIHSKSFDP